MEIDLYNYHRKREVITDAAIKDRLFRKEAELKQIFDFATPTFSRSSIRVAVLGCADRRLVAGHKEIFERVTGKKVDMITFDITLDHLQGAENIIQHDVTKPLPGEPFDVTYGHILLKFMNPESQWEVLKNSYNALRQQGMAIHLMNNGGKTVPTEFVPEGFFDIPLKDFESRLSAEGINYQELEVKNIRTGWQLFY